MPQSENTSLTTVVTPRDSQWRGYGIDELRLRRAYVAMKLEMEKAALYRSTHRDSETGGMLPVAGQTKNLLGKLLGALDYFDYAYIAFKTGSRLLKLFRGHHR